MRSPIAKGATGPTGATGSGRWHGDGGSVLILMPAAVLVVLTLGAIAVDLSIVQVRQREAVAAASGAANDAATAGLDQAVLRRGDGYRLSPALVQQSVSDSIAVLSIADQIVGSPRVTITQPDSVTVEIVLRARYIFARSIPRGPRSTLVRGTATASVRQR